jgi:hypothetical protein
MRVVERLRTRTMRRVARPKSGCCPPDRESVAEALVMAKLDPRRARLFAKHCKVCTRCAQELLAAREFVTAIRAALRHSPPSFIYKCPPVVFMS